MGPYKRDTQKSFALKPKRQTTIDVYCPSSLHGKSEKEHAYARIWMWGTHYIPGRYALRLAPRVRSVETMSRRSPRVQARIRGVRPSLSTHCTQKKNHITSMLSFSFMILYSAFLAHSAMLFFPMWILLGVGVGGGGSIVFEDCEH